MTLSKKFVKAMLDTPDAYADNAFASGLRKILSLLAGLGSVAHF